MTDQDPSQGHSPLPWDFTVHIGLLFTDINIYGAGCRRFPVALLGGLTGKCRANAALIVREVNEAPRLRERVKELEADADELAAVKDRLGEHPEICLEDRLNILAEAASAIGWRGELDLIAFLTSLAMRMSPMGPE